MTAAGMHGPGNETSVQFCDRFVTFELCRGPSYRGETQNNCAGRSVGGGYRESVVLLCFRGSDVVRKLNASILIDRIALLIRLVL